MSRPEGRDTFLYVCVGLSVRFPNWANVGQPQSNARLGAATAYGPVDERAQNRSPCPPRGRVIKGIGQSAPPPRPSPSHDTRLHGRGGSIHDAARLMPCGREPPESACLGAPPPKLVSGGQGREREWQASRDAPADCEELPQSLPGMGMACLDVCPQLCNNVPRPKGRCTNSTSAAKDSRCRKAQRGNPPAEVVSDLSLRPRFGCAPGGVLRAKVRPRRRLVPERRQGGVFHAKQEQRLHAGEDR